MTLSRTLRFIAAGSFAALTLFAVACGGGDDDDSTGDTGDTGDDATATATTEKKNDDKAGSYDPCTLLTKAEVEAALGEPIGEPKRGDTKTNPMGQQICSFGAASDKSLAHAQVSVIREKDFTDQLKKNGYTVKRLYDDGKALYTSTEPVSGIGDEAYRTENQVQVRAGKVTFTVSATLSDGGGLKTKQASTDTLVTLAKATLGRIPQ